MRRTLGLAAVGALAASSLGLAGPAAAVAPHSAALAATTVTNFAFEATAFGTKVRGGDIPAASGRTAYSHLGCTRRAGLDKSNHVAAVNLDSLASATTVRSRTWTTSGGGVVATNSRSSIAKLRIGDADRRLTLEGIVATTRSYHDSTGYGSTTSTSVADAHLTILGVTTPVALPTRGNPVTVPGVAVLSVGARHKASGSSFAGARAVSLKITVIPTDTKIAAGYASSRIDGDITGGIFHGYANGSQVRLLGNTVTSGRTSLQPMPCAGTRGAVQRTSTASVNALGVAALTGLESSVTGEQNAQSASGYTQAKVAKALLFGHKIRVNGVVARANVTLRADGTNVRSAKGTKLGGVFFRGDEVSLGADGVRKLGHLAVLRGGVVDKTPNGIDVVGLRIKLLAGDRSGSVIDLAHAKLAITRS